MQLNEKRRERLLNFSDYLSIDRTDKFISAAFETVNYSMNRLNNYLDVFFKSVMMTDYYSDGVSVMLELLGYDSTKPLKKDRRELVISCLKKRYGDYEKNEFAKKLSELKMTCNPSSRQIVLNGIQNHLSDKLITDKLKEICQVIRSYAPPFIPLKNSGKGRQFDLWDEYAYRFDEFDDFDMPFDFYETV
ncbi:MAG: hypothetical protein NC213_08310 [Acetobacter sp.]|nr:hypothetical protein [Bacteroides sp.]MCM1341732.1 hypothetical protein [Acetobacter sp.]MCM1432329.1 hypothetical protein [Clostridiales bacterium]